MRAKNKYPWRIGATSFVLPADIETNVRQLAPMVDDVQLLFFESVGKSTLAHPLDVVVLADLAGEHELSYSVHLPGDLRLGASSPALRNEGGAEIERLMTILEPLAPNCYDLHLAPEQTLATEHWQDNVRQGLTDLAVRLGEKKKLVAVENIDYPYDLVSELACEQGFSHCLDLGHVQRYGHDWQAALARIDTARHIHLHGLSNGKDHQGLSAKDLPLLNQLGSRLELSEYCGVVTFEVYNLIQLVSSIETVDQAWKKAEQ